MINKYELVVSEYAFPTSLNDCLGSCILYLEFFAPKSICAYDIHSNEVKLIRKLRKKLDRLVNQELANMETEIINNNTRILSALDSCSQKLAGMFQETDTLGNDVVFASIGIDGVIQTTANDESYQQHEQALVEDYRRLFLRRHEFLEKLESSQWLD